MRSEVIDRPRPTRLPDWSSRPEGFAVVPSVAWKLPSPEYEAVADPLRAKVGGLAVGS